MASTTSRSQAQGGAAARRRGHGVAARHEEVEAELRAYQSLYQGDEQRDRVRALREVALGAMRSLAAFRPYLSGPVLKGTAGRYADVDLQLFTDDLKAVELYLLNRNVPYDVSEVRHYCGDEARTVPCCGSTGTTCRQPRRLCAKDERAALKASPRGARSSERASRRLGPDECG